MTIETMLSKEAEKLAAKKAELKGEAAALKALIREAHETQKSLRNSTKAAEDQHKTLNHDIASLAELVDRIGS